jgi:hypothetical protein
MVNTSRQGPNTCLDALKIDLPQGLFSVIFLCNKVMAGADTVLTPVGYRPTII